MSGIEIDTTYLIEQLKALLAIDSPTGFTDTVVRYCTEELERLGLRPELTRRGAIRAVRQGSRRDGARSVVAHLDTLGAQVKLVKPNGRLDLVPIGNWSARFAEGARANIYAEERYFRGGILPLKASGHTYNDEIDTQPVGWTNLELRVDERTTSYEETRALGIDVGDIVAIDPQPEFLDSGFIVSRHLDDKAGAAITLATIEALERTGARTPVDIHFLFTIAEEVGTGATAIVAPEVASMVTVDNRFYRSDSASAVEAGHDVRTALVAFGVDASHGYERVHEHALHSIARLLTAYVTSPLEIQRDVEEISDMEGFTEQPTADRED